MSSYRFMICILYLCSLYGFLSSSLIAQQEKSVTVRPKEGPLKDKEVYSNSHALIIGISKYKNLPANKQLDFADKDAIDLRDVLIKSYGFPAENTVTLLNEQATLENIRKELANLTDRNRVKENDRVLIFFSGHGQTVKLTIGGEMGFLLPYDASIDLKDAENAAPYLSSCIKMREIWDNLEACPAKHSLLLADACFSGLLTKSKSGAEPLNAGALNELLRLPARQVITAGKKGQESLELAEKGHGAFTFKLLEKLNAFAGTEGNVLMASELGSGLIRTVSNLTNGKQTPQFANYETEGEFLLIATPPQPVSALNMTKTQPNVPTRRSSPSLFRTERPPKDAMLGDSWINPKDGAEMIYIPAGDFIRGNSAEEILSVASKYGEGDQQLILDHMTHAQPRQVINLDGYWMYKNMVTVAMYKKFCMETGYQMPEEPIRDNIHTNPNWSLKDHPIVNVSWEDAQEYCRWAGVELPTEAQWEKATRGTDGRIFPWGNIFDRNKLQCSKNGLGDAGRTCPVGKFTDSPYGCSDMVGNAWQWCRDYYDENYYKSAPDHNPENIKASKYRVKRGGSWVDYLPGVLRPSSRSFIEPSRRFTNAGFRCSLRQP